MPSEPPTGRQLYHGETLSPGTGVVVAGVAIFAIYATQIALVNASAPVLIAAVGGDALVLVALAVFARARGIGRVQLGLRRPATAFLAAATLIGVSMWLITMWIVALVHVESDTTELQAMVEQPSLLATILALALMPALTEEIIFRGILARSLGGWFRPGVAIGISAVMFGLYHIIPAQMISTSVFGLALGVLTLRSRSAIPAMIAHLLNNVIALVVSRDEIPGLWPWIGSHAVIALATSFVLATSGIVLAIRATS